MRGGLYLLIFCFLFSFTFAQLEITEVFPSPVGAEDAAKPQGEWVELYNSGDEPINLTDYILRDSKDDNELYITQTALLDDDLQLDSGEYIAVYRNGDSDFSLNNNGEEEVRLFLGNVTIDSMTYSGSTEGKSWSKVDDVWHLTQSTPGEENVFREGCDVALTIEAQTAIFVNTSTEFTIAATSVLGTESKVTVKGVIEDLNGRIVKEYSAFRDEEIRTQLTKSYSPRLKEGVYQITFYIENLSCDDIDITNNNITHLIAVNPQYQKNESSVNIEKVYLGNDKLAKWGDQIRVKVNVYKGDETKKTGEVWIEQNDKQVSKRSKITLEDKYKDYVLTIPVQLDSLCTREDKKYEASVVLSAFDLVAKDTITIKGVNKDVCKDYLSFVSKEQKEANKLSISFSDVPDVIDENVVPVKIQISNDDKEHDFKVWSFIYRGSKCYSCSDNERDENMKEFSLKAFENKTETFFLLPDSGMQGEYKIKVVLNKDGQKTNKEIVKDVFVESVKEETTDVLTGAIVTSDSVEITGTKQKIYGTSNPGIVVYQSSSNKAKELIPEFMAVTFGLLCLVLMMKK